MLDALAAGCGDCGYVAVVGVDADDLRTRQHDHDLERTWVESEGKGREGKGRGERRQTSDVTPFAFRPVTITLRGPPFLEQLPHERKSFPTLTTV